MSLTRLASSVVDQFTGGNKNTLTDKDSVKNAEEGKPPLNIEKAQSEKKTVSGYLKKKVEGSYKSGSGAGSVVTSLSDLERIEKIMTQA